ncbi:MAG: MoxR family ATPase [Bdellovibrionota bacterium]|nr:MoxR family ATPase [Deltaproteobacteria bacterium]
MTQAATENTIQSSEQAKFSILRDRLRDSIIGQEKMLERILIALLADGHLLVEGAPGLAKTRAINVLGKNVEGEFKRIQFTPDLLPSDLTGTDVFRPQDGQFSFRKGPLFHSLILADEINRAPAKVQSALLEAMGERQISVSGTTYTLPELFLVMATQNPIEQEGTYSLPEAQLDRFLMHIKVDYPDALTEKKILKCIQQEEKVLSSQKENNPQHVLSQKSIFMARNEVLNVYMSDELENYLIAVVLSTRNPGAYNKEFENLLEFGASPRATISLDRCARARAWLDGRNFVTPDDIQELAHDVLRHRMGLSYEAEAQNISKDKVISMLLEHIAVP